MKENYTAGWCWSASHPYGKYSTCMPCAINHAAQRTRSSPAEHAATTTNARCRTVYERGSSIPHNKFAVLILSHQSLLLAVWRSLPAVSWVYFPASYGLSQCHAVLYYKVARRLKHLGCSVTPATDASSVVYPPPCFGP